MRVFLPVLTLSALFLCLTICINAQTPAVVASPSATPTPTPLKLRFINGEPGQKAVSLLVTDGNLKSLVVTSKSTGRVSLLTIPEGNMRIVNLPLSNESEETYSIIGFGTSENDLGQSSFSVKDGQSVAVTGKQGGQGSATAPGSTAASKKKIEVPNIGIAKSEIIDLDITLYEPDKLDKKKELVIRVKNGTETISEEKLDATSAGVISSIQKRRIKLRSGSNRISAQVLDNSNANSPATIGSEFESEERSISCYGPCEAPSRSYNTRLVGGFEQGGSSSSASRTQPFLDFFINIPLNQKDTTSRPPKFSIWADLRLASSSIQKFADLASIASNTLNAGTDGGINDVVQSFKATAGIDVRLIPEKAVINSFFLAGKSSLSLIVGAGVTSPLTGDRRASAQIFKIPTVTGSTAIVPAFRELFTDVGINLDGKSNIAFVSPDRDRFYRRYFAGIRVKHHFYKNSERMELSPAQFDFTVGQDEGVTRKLSGRVFTFEAFTPIPYKEVDYLYFYAGISTKLTRNSNSLSPKFFLDNAPQSELNDANKTILIPNDHPGLFLQSRDTFFFGIGIDLVRLFGRSGNTSTPQ